MPADPKTVFSQAEVFRTGSQILGGYLPNLAIPWVVCAAFSLELYLKCLLLIEGGSTEKKHDLEKLFANISCTSREAIRKNYENKRVVRDAMFAGAHVPPPPPSDFDFVLHASALAFEKFRYAYEGLIEDGQGWLAGDIGECVRERIIALHPDWRI
jgi:hypothetical protein